MDDHDTKKSLLKSYSSLEKNYTVFVNQCGFDAVISVIKKVPLALANRTSCNIYVNFKRPPRSSKTVSVHCQRLF